MLKIKDGSVISIRHYSGIHPFKSILLGQEEENLTVKLTKDFAIMNFLEGDPVVFGYEGEEEVHVVGCDIVSIDAKENVIILKIDQVDSDSDKRQYERFPVSIYADVRTKESRKKNLAMVKDISHFGMLIYSKSDFRIGQELYFDIYMEKTMIFLKAQIVRKAQSPHYLEYGLRILYEDLNSMNFIKEYLKRLKYEQDEAIRKIKGF